MDPSNRLDFLLGDLRIEMSKMTADDWASLFLKLAERIKPRLQYYHGFLEYFEYLNDSGSFNGYSLVTSPETVNISTSLFKKPRFLLLTRDDPVKMSGKNRPTFKQEMFFIDQKGRYFVFRGEYERTSSETDNSIHLIAMKAEYSELTASDLKEMFEQSNWKPWKALRELLGSVEVAEARTTSRAKLLGSDKGMIHSIFSRMV